MIPLHAALPLSEVLAALEREAARMRMAAANCAARKSAAIRQRSDTDRQCVDARDWSCI